MGCKVGTSRKSTRDNRNKMKPNQKDFEFFKACCQEYIAKYELNDWTFRFFFKNKNNDGKESAWIRRVGANLQADIYLDNKYNFEGREDIRKAANHEILHCLVGELYLLAIDREGTYKEIDRSEEKLIHKLEKFLKD